MLTPHLHTKQTNTHKGTPLRKVAWQEPSGRGAQSGVREQGLESGAWREKGLHATCHRARLQTRTGEDVEEVNK